MGSDFWITATPEKPLSALSFTGLFFSAVARFLGRFFVRHFEFPVLRAFLFALPLAYVAVSLSGCQLNLNDKPKAETAIKFGGGEEGCLDGALPIIELYFEGSSKTEDVERAWECASTALKLFATHASGQQVDRYSASELKFFLERYFLTESKISDALLEEAMRLKQTLLGGDMQTLSRAELERIREIFGTLKAETVRLLPYVKIISGGEDVELVRRDPAQFERATQELIKSTLLIGGLFSQAKEPYELNHFRRLLQEIQTIYSQKSEWRGPEFLIKHLPTAAALKGLLLRPSGDVVLPQEWGELIASSGRLYAVYLRVSYFLGSGDLLSGPGLNELRKSLDELFDLLQMALNAKSDRTIAFAEIEKVITELYRIEVIKWKSVKVSTVQKIARVLLTKVFNAPPSGSVRPVVTGLTQDGFNQFREGISGWLDMQRAWSEVTEKAIAHSPGLRGENGHTKSIPLILVRQIWPKIVSQYVQPYEELGKIFNRSVPMSYGAEGTIIFERDPNLVTIDQATFDSLNWKSAFSRAVISGFSSEPSRNRTAGVTKDEFKVVFNDLRPLAIDINMIAADDMNVWSSTFDEANMFMLTGDGDDRLSFFEGFDLISFAMSNPRMARKAYTIMGAKCAHKGLDVFGIPKVEARCFREQLRGSFSEIYSAVPTWTRMISLLNEKEFEEFEKILETAARSRGYSDDLIESMDIDRMTMVIQYIESMFTRFDANGSGTLSTDEVRVIYPLFKTVLKEVSGVDDDETLWPAFTYTLKYGAPPSSITSKVWFKLFWQGRERGWDLQADRQQILRIIGQIRDPA